LFKICQIKTSNLSFSSIQLFSVLFYLLDSLDDFALIINNEQIKNIFSFLCCVSEKFLQIGSQIDYFEVSVPEEYLECVHSSLNFFK
jgi:hypothetical protein